MNLQNEIKEVWVSDSEINPCQCINISDALKGEIEKMLDGSFSWENTMGEGTEGHINFQIPDNADSRQWIGDYFSEDWDFAYDGAAEKLTILLADIKKVADEKMEQQ